jgi:hypothetical protein
MLELELGIVELASVALGRHARRNKIREIGVRL